MKNLCNVILICAFLSTTTQAMAQSKGKSTGRPLPRFVSLKSDRVNLRVGPGKQFSVQWLYLKPGLPVEIIQEFERWRRVRDSDSTEGWVFHSLLSRKRTAIVTPWEKDIGPQQTEKFTNNHSAASTDSPVTAKLQAGVIVTVNSCSAMWCEISAGEITGYVEKTNLWGVYPKEKIKQ